MNKKLIKIHEYLIDKGVDEETLLQWDSSSVYLSMEIMEYAHRNQKRENGEDYAEHPSRVLENYRKLVGIKPNDCFCIDKEMMADNLIPYDGAQEVCLLHDVIEDTDFTIEELREIYIECGFEKYFELYIEDALRKITHDKSMDYGEYIKICLKNPISAIVKMMDLQDNLRVIDLIDLNEDKYNRAKGYLSWILIINDAYHFLENANKYRNEYLEGSNL